MTFYKNESNLNKKVAIILKKGNFSRHIHINGQKDSDVWQYACVNSRQSKTRYAYEQKILQGTFIEYNAKKSYITLQTPKETSRINLSAIHDYAFFEN